jgi:hypothetical protein
MSYIGNEPTSVAFLTDTFSGNGSTTAFTLSAAPAGTSSILVAISGVVQDPSTYSVSGTTLTFSPAPPTGTGNISVRFLGIPASGVTTTAYRTVTEFTATSGQTTFSVPSYTPGFIDVYRNGVLLGSADYTASNGLSVVLVNGCTVGDLVEVISFQVSSVLNAIPSTAGAVGNGNIANGAVSPAKLSTGAPTWDTSGNLLVGTTTTGSTGISLLSSYNLGWAQNSGESVPNIFRQTSSAATVMANGYRNTATANGFASSLSASYAKSAISCGTIAGGITFYTDTAAAVAAGTDVTPTERMRIDNSGNLLVGTTSTSAGVRLRVAGGIIGCLDVFNNTTGSAANLQIDSNGFFARSTSSLKYKKNVQDATHGLADVLKLRSVVYQGKAEQDSGKTFGGLIAEEVHEAGLTEFVQYADDGTPDALSYGNMVSLLAKAIQEQQTIITDLKARIEALENK